MGILKQLFIPSFCESLFYPLYMEIFGKTYRHNPSWERLSLLPIGGSLLFLELSFCPSFLPFPLPCPALSFPSHPSVFPMDCLPILITYALPCLSYLLPPPLQPSLYYPFIDSLSFFPTQLWPAFK